MHSKHMVLHVLFFGETPQTKWTPYVFNNGRAGVYCMPSRKGHLQPAFASSATADQPPAVVTVMALWHGCGGFSDPKEARKARPSSPPPLCFKTYSLSSWAAWSGGLVEADDAVRLLLWWMKSRVWEWVNLWGKSLWWVGDPTQPSIGLFQSYLSRNWMGAWTSFNLTGTHSISWYFNNLTLHSILNSKRIYHHP